MSELNIVLPIKLILLPYRKKRSLELEFCYFANRKLAKFQFPYYKIFQKLSMIGYRNEFQKSQFTNI